MRQDDLPFTISGKAEASADIFLGEIGEVCQNLLSTHPSCQIREHVIDGDAHAADRRLATALARVKRDDVVIGRT